MFSFFYVALLQSGMLSNVNPLQIDSCQQRKAQSCPVSTISPGELAPTSSSLLSQQIAAQANQILVNGQRLPIAWAQWQENGQLRTGISDVGLVSSFGIELLSTSNPTLQPIQWYAPQGQTQSTLRARVTSTTRYLDITDWVKELGWQMVPQGNTLGLKIPSSQVLGIRQGKQAWGDRLVIHLDRPTPARLVHSPGKAIVILEASASAQLLSSFQSTAGNAITNIKFIPQSQRTQIEITLKNNQIRPQLITLNSPHRLAIDLHLDASIPSKAIQWAPGIQWRQETITIGSSEFPVVWLEIDPENPNLKIRPIRTNPQAAPGTSPLISLAAQSQVAAAINAGFFNRNNQLSLGLIRQDGEWISGPILNRGAIAWNDRGQFLIDRLTLSETLITETGQRTPILYLNSGYVKAGLSRYTRAWGRAYTSLTNNETIISVQGDRAIGQTQIPRAQSGQVLIPPQGYLLVYRGDTPIPFLSSGSRLQIQTASSPALESQYPFALGAGPLLVKNNRIVLNAQGEGFSDAFIRQQASRSAIGLTQQSNLIIAAVHNRAYGKGPTLAEMAQIMQRLGTVDALNLDGGSSTGLYLGGQLLDRSARSAARIHNGLGIFLQSTP